MRLHDFIKGRNQQKRSPKQDAKNGQHESYRESREPLPVLLLLWAVPWRRSWMLSPGTDLRGRRLPHCQRDQNGHTSHTFSILGAMQHSCWILWGADLLAV